jgi:septal ring factor EnvC (AmiA/AmiB activator)
MKEQVPFTKVDVEAAVKAKCIDLVADANPAALRIMLMNHCLEVKHDLVEKRYNDAAEDVEKWKHKSTGLEGRLKEALKDKATAEAALEEMKQAKEAAESEKEEIKAALEKSELAVDERRRSLAVYFENGFRRAKEQVLLFNPEAKVDELDTFKIIVDGELVDDE